MQKVFDRKFGFLSLQDTIAVFAIFSGLTFLLWAATHGFGIADESFYLTIPHRLLQGDSLLTDEWHVSQLSSVFLYIPFKLYVLINSSTEGIILFFRYAFVAFQVIVSIIIYKSFRKLGIFSVVATMIYLLHVPTTYFNLNYNSVGLAFMTFIGITLLMFEKESRIKSYFLGLLISCAILCNPLLIMIYIIFSLITVIYYLRKNKETKISKEIFGFKSWLFITLGCATAFVIFVIFVLSRTTVSQLIKNIPMLFTDVEYQFTSFMLNGNDVNQNIFKSLSSIKEIIDFNKYIFVLFAVELAVVLIDKKRCLRRKIYLPFAIVTFIGYLIAIIASQKINTYVYWMMPFAFLGLNCYLISEHKNKKMFYSLWLLGLFYAIIIDITSDTGPFTSIAALTISGIASVFFIRELFLELAEEFKLNAQKNAYKKEKFSLYIRFKNVAYILWALVLISQIATQIFVISDFKTNSFEYLGEDKSNNLHYKIEYGTHKGIVTTENRADDYYDILSDLDYFKSNGKKPLFVAENLPYCYLYLDMPYATYSSWFIGVTWELDMIHKRFEDYFNLHPEKIPKYFYIPYIRNLTYNDVSERAEKMAKKVTDQIPCKVIAGKEGYILEVIEN